jgi:DNA replication protein DnaC
MSQCYLFDQCNHKDCDKDFCIRKYKMDSLYSAALMTDSQKQHVVLKVDQDNTDLEQFKQLAGIEQNICKFVEEGKNLYLHSAYCGNGKSSWSIRLAQAYFNKIWARTDIKCRVLFISVPRFLLALKDNITAKNAYVDHIKDNVLEADLVIWDDIAAKMGS